MDSTKVDKWIWMMDWCKAQGLPPADARIWALAERAYIINTEKKGWRIMNFFQETEKEYAIEDSALLEAIRAKAAMSIALLAVGTVAADALLDECATKEELVEYIKQMYNIVCVGCAMEEKSNSVVH